ncbi:hypothetical protein ACCO45_001835 [Purpureocillium lilacinum]|uniref:Uncharacterized protein n=1 Tax=Purpureocillium lilacinum TaxID=33203 RepID=A0ACC4E849_PURLI
MNPGQGVSSLPALTNLLGSIVRTRTVGSCVLLGLHSVHISTFILESPDRIASVSAHSQTASPNRPSIYSPAFRQPGTPISRSETPPYHVDLDCHEGKAVQIVVENSPACRHLTRASLVLETELL